MITTSIVREILALDIQFIMTIVYTHIRSTIILSLLTLIILKIIHVIILSKLLTSTRNIIERIIKIGGALYNNHIAKHLNINCTSCRTSTADNYPHNCTNEQLSSTLIPQASDPVSLAPQVTTCTVNNLSHNQDDSNCPYMNLRDNNYNINNNNTDTSNSSYEHIHLNINQYTQPIQFYVVRDNIHDNIIQTMNTTSETISENYNDMGH